MKRQVHLSPTLLTLLLCLATIAAAHDHAEGSASREPDARPRAADSAEGGDSSDGEPASKDQITSRPLSLGILM